ncbi:hypothetical protein DPX16_16710 [Anabarilius grahami]|uniref:Uncharacterized protein n=1 Tax=Anabarilius grahami TaxID=495550 RepID=A0A3N0YSD6_ANAGA|nr:hypothetical protein DPX16_16710 [Anabarilius grahami]
MSSRHGERHHGGADGGKSQGGALAECSGETQGPTDGGRTKVCGETGGAERPTDQSEIHSLKAQGGAAGLRERGGDGGSADWGDDREREGDREARGKEKPSGAEGVKGREAAGGPEVHGRDRAMTD